MFSVLSLRNCFVATLVALVAVSAAAPATAQRSAESRQTLDLEGFDRIEIGGVYVLDVRVGGPYSVQLSGSPAQLERSDVRLSGSTLKLSQKGSRGGRGEESISARITMPSLTAVSMSGVVDGRITGVDADAFRVAVSGVGELNISGRCDSLRASVSGVGELNCAKLICRTAMVSVSGVGEATVYASEAVDASVSGMGSITVYGSPGKVKKSGGMFADVTIK